MPALVSAGALLVAGLALTVPAAVRGAPDAEPPRVQPAQARKPRPPAPQATSGQSELVARGEYLANVAHCAACHTREGGRPYAGNLPITSSFGVMYGSNITPDPTTGIGNWSEQDFEGALRRGVGTDGRYLYPAMPYLQFTKIRDEDVKALYAYFRTVEPVREATRKPDMKFPFNVRLGIAGWQGMYFKQGRYVDDPSRSAAWNRGAYFVQGLGHCEACHTPTNIALAPKRGKSLQGAVVDHWFAPDISGGRYSGIRNWSERDVATYLKTGHNQKNEAAVGLMQQTIDFGLSRLDDSDLAAIATYLKNQDAEDPETAPKPIAGISPQQRAQGQALYAGNCQSCHGADGKGQPGIAPALAQAASVSGGGPETAIRAVLQGFAPHGQWGVMPSFAQVLTPQEIADVLNHVRTSWGNAGGGTVTASTVNKLARLTDGATAGVTSALICPSASTRALDPTTTSAVRALPKDGVSQRDADRLVRDYRTRHPKSDNTDIVTTLSGAYCRDVMAASAGTLADRQKRFVDFTGRVAAATVR